MNGNCLHSKELERAGAVYSSALKSLRRLLLLCNFDGTVPALSVTPHSVRAMEFQYPYPMYEPRPKPSQPGSSSKLEVES